MWCELWKIKLNPQNIILLPLFLCFDDFKINNPVQVTDACSRIGNNNRVSYIMFHVIYNIHIIITRSPEYRLAVTRALITQHNDIII